MIAFDTCINIKSLNFKIFELTMPTMKDNSNRYSPVKKVYL